VSESPQLCWTQQDHIVQVKLVNPQTNYKYALSKSYREKLINKKLLYVLDNSVKFCWGFTRRV